mmetsp:Transcript_4350/g.11952  ORF Transcript_4350/g.11952 Transcript_4350/m.11952 type:complete len:464 (-) Transcript_4350:28-1419(-)
MGTKRRKRRTTLPNNNPTKDRTAKDNEGTDSIDGGETVKDTTTTTPSSTTTPNGSDLFMPLATYHCAWRGNGTPEAMVKLCCIPCAYKIGCFDVALDKEFTRRVPNARPESCPRIMSLDTSKSNDSTKTGIDRTTRDKDDSLPREPALFQGDGRCLGYRAGLNVLTVGDGDFSFTLALARLLAAQNDGDKKSRIIATSYESKESLERVYPTTFESTLRELNQITSNDESNVEVQIHFQVDATQLSTYNILQPQSFDRIVWNFPCSAVSDGRDGQNSEMEENKTLVANFVKEAAPLLTKSGQIHMNHKTKPPFDQWKIEEVAMRRIAQDVDSDGTLGYLGRVVWDRALFPPHVPRKARHCKSFSTHDARTYVFAEGHKSGSPRSLADANDSGIHIQEIDFADDAEDLIKTMGVDLANTTLVPVTTERILKLRGRLLNHAELQEHVSRAQTGSNSNGKRKRKRAR